MGWKGDGGLPGESEGETQAERLYGLDWLRCFAILSIVAIHASDEIFRRHAWFPRMNMEALFFYAFNTILRFGTLTFFMMTAFLMESRLRRTSKRPEARW